ncbi:MAG: hypothetical protein KGI50_05850 [Patescibacteria group bacterium]|nr:hypothetical protein [Patescibacteria group bacterium]
MTIPAETLAALGRLIPEGYVAVGNGVVKPHYLIWSKDCHHYREPYAGELNVPVRQFLSVVRKK